jgi:hypothetical protein
MSTDEYVELHDCGPGLVRWRRVSRWTLASIRVRVWWWSAKRSARCWLAVAKRASRSVPIKEGSLLVSALCLVAAALLVLLRMVTR